MQFSRPRQSFPDVQFTIAGDGPLRSHVERASAENANVHYLGWLNRRELRETIDRSDALLLPSHFETFGTIALEAMARGKLVLVSEHCGLAHWHKLRGRTDCFTTRETLSRQLEGYWTTPKTRVATPATRHDRRPCNGTRKWPKVGRERFAKRWLKAAMPQLSGRQASACNRLHPRCHARLS